MTGQESTNEIRDRNKIERQRETQNDKRDKKMTTRDKILKSVIFLSLAVIICHDCHSVSLFVSQFYFCLKFHLYFLALSVQLNAKLSGVPRKNLGNFFQ
jgi:hypothetical protein